MKKLCRCKDGYIGGVCGGVADYLNIDRTVVRVLYAFLTLVAAPIGIVGYIVCMFLMPMEDDNIIDG